MNSQMKVDQPELFKDYFEIAWGNGMEDFSKVLEWAKGVMDMYQEDLEFLKKNVYTVKIEKTEKYSRFEKAWKNWIERKRILIEPDFKADSLDAFYFQLPDQKFGGLLRFNSYQSKTGKIVYTSQNKDIVCHEAGHAFLDVILSHLYDQMRLQTGAIHESFGDLTCLFYHLSERENRVRVLEETEGDLSVESFLTLIGEPLNLGAKYGELRSLKNNKKMGQTDCEVHDLSNVFSAVIYELLEELFKKFKSIYNKDQEQVLDSAQRYLRLLILRSLIEFHDLNPSFSDIGKQMKDIAQDWDIFKQINFAEIIRRKFSDRGIDINMPHTNDDEICKIPPQQADQSMKSSFCVTFKKSLFQRSKW